MAKTPEEKLAACFCNPEMEVYSGFRLHGVNAPDRDVDTVAVVIAPEEYRLGLYGPKGQQYRFEETTVADGVHERVIISATHFLAMLAEGNIRALECLFAVRQADLNICEPGPFARRLSSNIDCLLSKRLFDTFAAAGYAESKRTFAETTGERSGKHGDDIERHGYSPRNAYDCVRIFHEGIQIADTHGIEFPSPMKLILMDILVGHFAAQEMRDIMDSMLRLLDAAFSTSTLPAYPAYEFLNGQMKLLYGDEGSAASRPGGR